MFYVRTLLLAFFTWTPSLEAMQPALVINEESLETPFSNELTKLAQKLNRYVSSYYAYLPSSLGCSCCRAYHELFNTDEYQHYEKRKNQLEKLKSIVEKPIWMPQEVLLYIDKSMAPFNGLISANFERDCKAELQDFIRRFSEKIKDEENCLICFERKATLFSKSCGHLTYCTDCYKGLNDNNRNKCPICSQNTNELVEIKAVDISAFCALCGVNKPNVFISCNHLVLCEYCLKSKKPAGCPLCHRKINANHKLHFSGVKD